MDLDVMAAMMGTDDFQFWMDVYCASLTGTRTLIGESQVTGGEKASLLAICDADRAVQALKAKRLAMVQQAKQKTEARDTALVRAVEPWTGESLRDAHARLNGDVPNPWVMERPEVRWRYEELAWIANQRMGSHTTEASGDKC